MKGCSQVSVRYTEISAFQAVFSYLCTSIIQVRYDLDNALKTICDCLQYVGAITDDNLCSKIVAEKSIDRRNPRVEFFIIEEQLNLF